MPRPAAELIREGVSRDVLRGPRWRATRRGFYVPAQSPDEVLLPTQRILDVAPDSGDRAVLAGWAAAFVAGVDSLDGLDPMTMTPEPVDITLLEDVGRRGSARIRYHREVLPPSDQHTSRGIRVTSGDRTTFDGARWATNLAEAVAFADACAHHGLVAPSRWMAYVESMNGFRGVGQARDAALLFDAAARNPWESRLRVFVIIEVGLPKPLVNTPVFDLDGRLLGIPDLLLEDAGLVIEFDGTDHRRRSQHRADNVREETFEDAGLTVVRADSLDLRDHRKELHGRVSNAHQRGLRRDRSSDRWTTTAPPWWDEVHPVPELTDAEKDELLGTW